MPGSPAVSDPLVNLGHSVGGGLLGTLVFVGLGVSLGRLVFVGGTGVLLGTLVFVGWGVLEGTLVLVGCVVAVGLGEGVRLGVLAAA